MQNESYVPGPDDVKASLTHIVNRLLSEYPRLSLPVAVVFALFGLATVCKTLIEGFAWAHTQAGYTGVLLFLLMLVLMSTVAIVVVGAAVAPRPIIQQFPRRHLSRSPTIRWEYKGEVLRPTSYELRIKVLKSGQKKRIPVPERMRHLGLAGITGAMEISVHALAGGRRARRSRKLRTEIYEDSIQRIRETGTVKVAVHADPGEDIFCFRRDGRWQGFDIDCANLIASELQEDENVARPLTVEYSYYDWPEVISAPSEHEVDMSIASITISTDRAKRYGIRFSTPYAESRLGVVACDQLIAGKSPKDSVSLEALKGRAVAVHKDTTASAFLACARKNVRYQDVVELIAENNDQLREWLRDKVVEAVLYDYHRAFALLEDGLEVLALDQEGAVRAEHYGIAFSRVNVALVDKIDRIIRKHRLRLDAMLDRCTVAKRRAICTEESGGASATPTGNLMKRSLFVYGSLMYEEVWRRLVKCECLRIPARLYGYRRLKVRHQDYPGIVRGVGVVQGIVWLDVDDATLRRLDQFEADCYERLPIAVVSESGEELLADVYEIRESHVSVVDDREWDQREFERRGLRRFLRDYDGFRE